MKEDLGKISLGIGFYHSIISDISEGSENQ